MWKDSNKYWSKGGRSWSNTLKGLERVEMEGNILVSLSQQRNLTFRPLYFVKKSRRILKRNRYKCFVLYSLRTIIWFHFPVSFRYSLLSKNIPWFNIFCVGAFVHFISFKHPYLIPLFVEIHKLGRWSWKIGNPELEDSKIPPSSPMQTRKVIMVLRIEFYTINYVPNQLHKFNGHIHVRISEIYLLWKASYWIN